MALSDSNSRPSGVDGRHFRRTDSRPAWDGNALPVKRRRVLILCCRWSAVVLFAAQIGLGAEEPSPANQAAADSSLEDAERARRLAEIDTLWDEAQALKKTGDFVAAEERARSVLAIERELLGDNDPQSISTLDLIAQCQIGQEAWDAARATRAAALERSIDAYGEQDYRTVNARLAAQDLEQFRQLSAEDRAALHAAASTARTVAELYGAGRYADALPLARDVRNARQLILGEHHREFANSLMWLAILSMAQNKPADAEAAYVQALDIYEAILGRQHPDYATTLNNLAYVYSVRGDFALAEPLYREALGIQKELLGEQSADYAASLNNLAALYMGMGDVAHAEPLYRQALDIRKEVLGDRHELYGASLNNLAFLLQFKGDYPAAERLFRQALEIRRDKLGAEHPDYAASLNNLACLYQDQGDLARAEPLFREASKVLLEAGAPQDYAKTLNNLALVYQSQGQPAQAEALYEEVLQIIRSASGERHPDYAIGLNNLAHLYNARGAAELAEPLYQQVVDIRREILGERHPLYASALNNLGQLYESQGDLELAEPLYRQALAIWKEMPGDRHPTYARGLNNMALLLADLHRADEGFTLSSEAFEIVSEVLQTSAAVQSERQQLAMAHDVNWYRSNLIALGRLAGVDADQVYPALLASKGQVLLRQRTIRALRQVADSSAADVFNTLADRTRELDRIAKLSPARDSLDAYRSRLEELTLEVDRLQQELAGLSAEYRKSEELESLTPDALAALLPVDAALIDFRQFRQYSPHDDAQSTNHSDWQYAAFVTRRDRPLQVVWLGAIEPIDAAIQDWRSHFGGGLSDDAAQQLRLLVWEPLLPFLEEVTTVLISPEGELHGMPFSALPGATPGTYLIEERAFVTVAAPLLLPEYLGRTSAANPVPTLLTVGDVDYGADPGGLELATVDQSAMAARGGDGLADWKRLPDSREEVERIEQTMVQSFPGAATVSLRQSDATEQEFRTRAPAASYLHLATHGYFAPEELRSVLSMNRAGEDAISLFAQQDVSGWHPGLLSGIVLAGANQPADPQRDDGVLTALEVAALDLSGVELVVLSACETGLGQAAGGEGVLGLQRSFQLAGVRTSVASLWQVSDAATRSLMVEFYDNLWNKKLSRIEALRQAQLSMLREGTERGYASRGIDPVDVEEDGRVPPYYWAAFVLSGDWR